MTPFSHIRDAPDFGIRKEQQTTGDDDGYWIVPYTPAQTIAQENSI